MPQRRPQAMGHSRTRNDEVLDPDGDDSVPFWLVDRIAAFAAAVNKEAPALDRTAALLASAVRPPVDIDDVMQQLDVLGSECVPGDFADVCSVLFRRAAFRGDVARYNDPENSFIDAVLERRVGIPISLSIVTIEVGRRAGVAIDPISMPGHFLVQDHASKVFCDPFHGGELLDEAGCRRRHDALFGGRRVLREQELVPVSVPAVLARVLNNLEQSRLGSDPVRLGVLLSLHAVLPGLPAGEHLALAARFAAIGRFGAAGAAAQRAVAVLDGDERLVAERAAGQYWACTN